MNTALDRMKYMAWIVVFLGVGAMGTARSASAEPNAPRLTAEQLRQDLAFIRRTISENHPDLAFSVNTHALGDAYRTLHDSIRAGMTQDETWAWLATLNPVLADGHLFIGYPDWRGGTAAYLKTGGTLFPYEVGWSDGRPVIRAMLGGGDTPLRDARIVAIDGQPIAALTSRFLDRMHGDTLRFRAALLAQRWWFYYQKLVGTPASYRLTLARGEETWTVDTAGSRELPLLLRTEAEFDRQFHLDFDAGGTALLTIGSFAPEDLDRFLTFTHDAFARIQQAGSATLKIDVSANGGGDDPTWIKGLMPYLATTAYCIGSTYKKRVTVENAEAGEQVGQIVSGTITTWHQPQRDNPLLFKGSTQVVIGEGTYSSAVLFANVLTDFGFARLAGKGGAARRTQSGGVRRFTLPNSRLALWVPSFVLDPPDRAARGALLNTGKPQGDAGRNAHSHVAAP